MSTHTRSRHHDPSQRKWKPHKSGVTPQLRDLIEKAGGQTAFGRAVWGDEKFGEHKGKVAKWYYGRTGIRVAEARVVSTKPDSLRVSVWIATWTSCASATERQQSMAAG